MATKILRVFTDADGNFGDTASIVIDEGRHIPDSERQAIARKLNTGETAFVNDVVIMTVITSSIVVSQIRILNNSTKTPL